MLRKSNLDQHVYLEQVIDTRLTVSDTGYQLVLFPLANTYTRKAH